MIDRRAFAFGSMSALSAAAAWKLEPRHKVSLAIAGSLDSAIPMHIKEWSGVDVGNLLDIKSDGDLSAKLYSQLVERVYTSPESTHQVMMLVAYGDSQTNNLQLHRPEVCYPSFGYTIMSSSVRDIILTRGVEVPGRMIYAKAPDRSELVLYWSRLGEFLPTNGGEQRLDRLKTAMSGEITDGMLARFSVEGEPSADALATLNGFIANMVASIAPINRAAFIGSIRAASL